MDNLAKHTIGLLVGLIAVACAASPAHARTWFVNVGGTGDVPTIQAALDTAVAGDTVLVGPGVYSIPTTGVIIIRENVTFVSQFGPQATIIEPEVVGVVCPFLAKANSRIEGFWIKRFFVCNIAISTSGENVEVAWNIIEVQSNAAGIVIGASATISNNLIFGDGVGLQPDTFDIIYVNNNIILNGIDCFPYGPTLIVGACNDVIGFSCTLDNTGSFSLNPQFCGKAGTENFFLQADSPCAPGNNPIGIPCGLVGPLPVGCGTVATKEKTWGAIKALYEK